MTLIVDASVVLKWVLPDEDDVQAAEALARRDDLAAPDFLILEAANALVQAGRRGRIIRTQAEAALAYIQAARIRWVDSGPLIPQAVSIALKLERSAYDSLYLAVALAEGATLITADARFVAAAEAHPVYAPHLRRL